MTPLAVLLAEIWAKDDTFYIEQGAFSTDVVMKNRSRDGNACIEVKTDSLGKTIQRVWSFFYGKERVVNDSARG